MTVTADAVRINGRRYKPYYVLDTYENGDWTPADYADGASFTVTAGDKPQRLTCKWAPKGLSIMIR